MKILTSDTHDLAVIFRLYDLATEYQKRIFPDNTWPEFKKSLIETEISEERQFKLVIEEQIACVWAIAFDDPYIWEERNRDPSLYIHRIATHPDFRGLGFVSKIVDWAKEYASFHGKNFIRMDTCGNNQKLIGYYTKSGFDFLGMVRLKHTDALPAHYQDMDVCLFEIGL